MSVHTLQSSFNAGALTPLMDARVSVEKYEAGCRILENFIVETHGPLSRRPGLEYLGRCQSDAVASRLVGMEFANSQIVAELGPTSWRFWKDGVLLGDFVAHPYSAAELDEVQICQVNDVIYLTHYNHAPLILGHYGDEDWRVREIHEPEAGWAAGGSGVVAAPATGTATLQRWTTSPFGVTTVAAAAAWADAHAATATVAASGAPAGTGGSYPACIQRVRAWFVPSASGSYKFQASGIDDNARVMFESTAGGTGSGATVIISVSLGTQQSAAFPLVAGKGYWIEFLLNDYNRPGAGTFQFKKDAGAWTTISKAYLADAGAGAIGSNGTLEGWPAMGDENITEKTITASATSGDVTLTASAAIWETAHVGAWWQIAHTRETAFSEYVGAVGAFAGSSTEVRLVGRYEVFSYGIWSGTVHLERKAADGTYVVVRSWKGKKDRNISITGTADEEGYYRLRVVSGDGDAASTAAVPRFILEASDAVIYGLVRITAFTSATVVTATVYASLWSTAATTLWTEGAWSKVQGFPRTMTLHEQRTVWGGTKLRPQALWASVTGDFENFRRSSLDDGSWFRTLASESSHVIEWMSSQDTLVIGTSRGFWVGESPDGLVLTPVAGKFTRKSGAGSAYKQAILANESLLFLQSNGRTLRRLSYRDDLRRYGSADLTVLSDVMRAGIKQMVWQSQPKSIVWAVTNDGLLLGLTLEEEQNVFAWHVHRTDGLFKSVAVITGIQSDEVWVVVERDGLNFMERFEPLTYGLDEATWDEGRFLFADAGKVIVFEDVVTTCDGLDHLEGREVVILGDGAEQEVRTVTGGSVVIDPPAAVICVGLAYESKVQKMKTEIPLPDGTGQARRMKTARVTLRLYKSNGGVVQEAEGEREEVIPYREADGLMDSPITLFTGSVPLVLEGRHRESMDVIVSTDSPYPFTLVALIPVLEIYEN